MFPQLYDDQRRCLTRVALILCCGSIAMVPFVWPSSMVVRAAIPRPSIQLRLPVVPSRLHYPPIVVARDPFAGDSTPTIADRQPSELGENTAASAIMQLPPNVGADGFVRAGGTSAGAFVRAVVLGSASRALVEAGGAVEILGVGDAIAGSTVAKIDSQGLLLTNGSRIGLVEKHP